MSSNTGPDDRSHTPATPLRRAVLAGLFVVSALGAEATAPASQLGEESRQVGAVSRRGSGAGAGAAHGVPAGQELPGEPVPASFAGGLVDLLPTTEAGTALRLCTDSGGGALVVRERVAREEGWLEGEAAGASVPFPGFRPGESVPAPVAVPPRLRVLPDSVDAPIEDDCDGFLGAPWFAGKSWTMNYPAGRLLHHPDGLPNGLTGDTVPLGFQADSAGRHTSHFPRIDVVVDGDSLSLLLDTGARLRPGERARRALGVSPDGPGTVATSFIAAPVFRRWRRRHPGWEVVPDAGTFYPGQPMIRVPSVTVGDVRVGPVWFTRRPARNFLRGMSRWMDVPVVGALGGSALRYLRISISYPAERAVIARPARAGPTASPPAGR